MQTKYHCVCPLEAILMYQTMLPAQLKEPSAIVSPRAVEDLYGFPQTHPRFLKELTLSVTHFFCCSTVPTALGQLIGES